MRNLFQNQDDDISLGLKEMKTNISTEPSALIQITIIYFALFILGFNFLGYRAFNLESIKIHLRVGAPLLLIFSMFFNKYKFSVREFILVFYIGFLLLINGLDMLNFTFFVIFAIVTKVISKDDLLKIFNRINLTLLFILICSLITGVLSDTQYVSSLGRTRNMIGFNNPNAASLFLFSVLVTFILTKESYYTKKLLIAIPIGIYIYLNTDTRTAFVGLLLYAIFYFMFKWMFKFKRITAVCYLVKVFVVLIICSSFLSSFIIELIPQLDLILSYRLSIFSNYIDANSLRNLLLGGTKLNEIDNFYLVFMYTYGIVIFIFVSILILRTVGKLFAERNPGYLAFIIAILCMALTESSIMRPELLFVLLFWKIVFLYAFTKNSKFNTMNKEIYGEINK